MSFGIKMGDWEAKGGGAIIKRLSGRRYGGTLVVPALGFFDKAQAANAF